IAFGIVEPGGPLVMRPPRRSLYVVSSLVIVVGSFVKVRNVAEEELKQYVLRDRGLGLRRILTGDSRIDWSDSLRAGTHPVWCLHRHSVAWIVPGIGKCIRRGALSGVGGLGAGILAICRIRPSGRIAGLRIAACQQTVGY